MRLRYTGATPVSFVGIGLEVGPDCAEFDVSDDAAASFLARGDVEEAPTSPRRRAVKAAVFTDPAGAAPAPVTEEVSGGVPDDH